MTGAFAEALLQWFDREARDLPWRLPQGGSLRRDPYQVIVSEIMLQQTQVAAVIPYYNRFLERFPDFAALAKAEETEVLKYWEGLGYYRRARMLRQLALRLTEEYGGLVPRDRKTLLSLPGIGPYTAGAVLSFAFDLAEPAVDGNLVRVFARLDAKAYVQGDAKAQGEVRERLAGLIPPGRPGDFSEALIELGATICLPRNPLCGSCPVRNWCRANALSQTHRFPLPAKRPDRPVRRLTYVLAGDGGNLYCRRRSDGLLQGLYEFLSLPEKAGPEGEREVEDHFFEHYPRFLAGKPAVWSYLGEGRTVFSHRVWEYSLWEAKLGSDGLLELQDAESQGNDLITAFGAEALKSLPFPAFLVPWRDGFIKKAVNG